MVHEFSHGLWQYAEQEAKAGRTGLRDKLHQIAKSAPDAVKDAVGRNYYDQNPNVILEECFTHEMARRSEQNKAFVEAISTVRGKYWYKKVWRAIKDTWAGFSRKMGFGNANVKKLDKMTAHEAAEWILGQMAKGKRFGDVRPGPSEPDGGGETRKSISGIYTGSKANYNKPSLLAIGTGEGSQVYGWGLYGSSVKGVGEGYARQSRDLDAAAGEAIYKIEGKTLDRKDDVIDLAISYLSSEKMDSRKAIENIDKNIDSYNKELQTVKDKLSWDKNNFSLQIEADSIPKRIAHLEKVRSFLKENGEKIEKENPSENLYEQTFFTNREPGDESHLLKWYQHSGNIKEQLRWIREQASKEGFLDKQDRYGNTISQFLNTAEKTLIGRKGEDIYNALEGVLGSPKAASEFLARAGIDGVKYPVDSYGGKPVKNGDEVGWNYVSFRDDNIRVDRKWVNGVEQAIK